MSIHESLKGLLPCEFESVPQDDKELAEYIRKAVANAQELVDSVPPAPADSSQGQPDTISAAGSGDQVRASEATSDASFDEDMRKAWGKTLKLSAKDNPHRMAVYKMAGKDRRGAWFARRSVHEGLGFARWKRGLLTEFNDSLQKQGKPGEGNVRGIGGEKVVVEKEIPGVGTVQVFHLTAQFPGPSAPRDFVELLISSTTHPTDKHAPRQYMLVSKPVKHQDVPEQGGYVRGQYESVEFIREIPLRKTKMMSSTSLPVAAANRDRSDPSGKEDLPNLDRPATDTELAKSTSENASAETAEAILEARQASDGTNPTAINPKEGGKDSDKDSGVEMAVDENDELAPNPVEWIMITRSDPGGSVPKFMVERGTPGAIVSDAGKFLEWATQNAVDIDLDVAAETEADQKDREAPDTEKDVDEAVAATTTSATASAAARHAHGMARTRSIASTSSSSSTDSFVSFESVQPPLGRTATDTEGLDKYERQEHQLGLKLGVREAKAELELDGVRERHPDNESRVKKAEEKRERKVAEAQKWFEKEMAKVQQRREKAEKKARESGSKTELKERIEALTKENEELKKRIAELETSM